MVKRKMEEERVITLCLGCILVSPNGSGCVDFTLNAGDYRFDAGRDRDVLFVVKTLLFSNGAVQLLVQGKEPVKVLDNEKLDSLREPLQGRKDNRFGLIHWCLRWFRGVGQQRGGCRPC